MSESNNFNGMGAEMAKAQHMSKSYVGRAFLTLVLYYIGFYVVGLIFNLIYLSAANKSKQISGVSPSGRGCLIVLLWVNLIIPLILILAIAGVVSLPFL